MTTPTSDETPEQATRRMFTEAQDTVADWPQIVDGEIVGKPVSDPSIQPGDIITFGFDGIKHGRPSDYGYVEVVGQRPAWRRFVDCLMWWKR